MKITFGKFTLVDAKEGIFLASGNITPERLVDIETYPEAAEPQRFDRGNRSKTIRFNATRTNHKDEDACMVFCLEHDETLPIIDTLTIVGFGQTFKRVYERAALTLMPSQWEGMRSDHSYEFHVGIGKKK